MSDDYNRHDQELQAIEKWLLNDSLQSSQQQQQQQQQQQSADTIGKLNSIIDQINNAAIGVGSSGYAMTSRNSRDTVAQREIFPTLVQNTFLTNKVSSRDRRIEVISTNGFPSAGILTILSQADANSNAPVFVEWIKYSGITPNTFLNCQRGLDGTVAGEWGASQGVGQNLTDDCFTSQALSRTGSCRRNWPTYRNNLLYTIPLLKLKGTKLTLANNIRNNGTKFNLTNPVYDPLYAIAVSLGIAGTKNGVRNLTKMKLTQAVSFVQELENANLLTWSDDGSTHLVGNYPMAVFLGRLSVQYSPSAWRKKLPTMDGSKTGIGPFGFAGVDVVQSGDARISLSGTNNDTFYGLVNYRVFAAPPALSGTLTQQGK